MEENKLNCPPVFYAVGTGPGDPELMTIKARKVILQADVIILPNKSREECAAYRIASGAVPEIEQKQIVLMDFVMTRDESVLEDCWNKTAQTVASFLDGGKTVAMITIGDPSVYSTALYVLSRVASLGHQVRIVSGVPSFCAASGACGIPLVEGRGHLHVIPASHNVSGFLSSGNEDPEGTYVFMKSGRNLAELKKILEDRSKTHSFDFYAVSNCGYDDEKIFRSLEEFIPDGSYMTLVMIKNIVSRGNGSSHPLGELKEANRENEKFFSNTGCRYFPCHKTENEKDFNCMFCFCPLYSLGEKCGGNFTYSSRGIKSCIDCDFPHKKENYQAIMERLKKC